MRILMITAYIPYPPFSGNPLRNYNLLRRIAREHEVWLAAFVGASDEPLIVNAVRAGVSLIANLVFIPVFGFVGAAITNVVGNLAAIPLDMIFLYRRKIIAGIRDYLKPVMAFGVCGLVFLSLGSSRGWIRVGIVGLFSMTCVLVSAMTTQDLTCLSKEVSTSASRILRRNRLKGTP